MNDSLVKEVIIKDGTAMGGHFKQSFENFFQKGCIFGSSVIITGHLPSGSVQTCIQKQIEKRPKYIRHIRSSLKIRAKKLSGSIQ